MTNAKLTGKRCMCSGCGECFSTPGVFDKHRRKGRCLDPAILGMEIKEGPGGTWWGMPGNFRPRKGEVVPYYRQASKRR